MAIKSLEQRKRQQILLIVALAILVIATIILYFGFWKKGAPVSEEIVTSEEGFEIPAQEQRQDLVLEAKLKRIKLDINFLKETILPFLEVHGDLPVEKGETGRANPFVPY